MCRRVETDYRDAPNEAERLEKIGQILAEGVYAYLKRRGLLTTKGAQTAQNSHIDGHRREAKILDE